MNDANTRRIDMHFYRALVASSLLVAALTLSACGNTGKGAAIGAAAGAGVGALGGGSVLGNAATGAVVGGAGGFIYDQVKDDD
jgi:osmotically inducible lipoprotein OsmB